MHSSYELMSVAVGAPGKEEAKAAEGMRAVLGALRRRLEDGCRAVQDAEQLAARKAALICSSLQLLHNHCARTFRPARSTLQQPAPQTAGAAGRSAGGNEQHPSRGDQQPSHGSFKPASAVDGTTAAPALVCEELSAALEGECCVVHARVWDRSGTLDLRSAQLLASFADGPVIAAMQPPQDATQQPISSQGWDPQRQRGSRGGSYRLCSRVDIQGLVSASSRASLDIIAVVFMRAGRSADSHAQAAAGRSGSGQGVTAVQTGQHMQHLGSLTLDWPEMLRRQARTSSAASLGASAAPEPRLGAEAGDGGAVPDNFEPENAAAGSTAPMMHQQPRAATGDAQSDARQQEQPWQVYQQASAARGPEMPSQHLSEARLCLEADQGSVGDVPKILEDALGLRTEWITSECLFPAGPANMMGDCWFAQVALDAEVTLWGKVIRLLFDGILFPCTQIMRNDT